MALTNIEIKNAEAREKTWKLSDGGWPIVSTAPRSAEALLAAAKAQKAAADANLSRTELRSTTKGLTTRLTVAGQLATPGQGMMILTPLEVWMTANLKETRSIYKSTLMAVAFRDISTAFKAAAEPVSACCPQKMRREIM